MTFSTQAWQAITPIYAAILDHPFNRELAQGRLDRARFQRYMLQDAYYLQDYARALASVAARSPQPDAVASFADDAANAVRVERALHTGYFAAFGIPPEAVSATRPTPSCFAYTSFLLACAHHRPYEVLLAAVLPCYWIYWEVGKHIYQHAAPANPYQAWIDTYAGEAFGAVVRSAIGWTDAAAQAATPARQAEMMEAFHRSTQLEWMFWESAYRDEAWPI
ncbi:thiaminase II [Chloroflexia bacterium SDU3-3]|nr:thiaminase II [Chloroflexia bacterium SDU3-3]